MALEDYNNIEIESEEEDIEESGEKNIRNVFGGILIFCFLSIVFIFIASLIVIETNNEAIIKMYNITSDMVANGIIPASYLSVAEDLANNYPVILDYFDMFWLLSFVGMVISALIYSYFAKRENYFSVLTYVVIGILFLSFIGGIFVQTSSWFKDNFLQMMPTILPKMPMFAFYLDYCGVINLILIILVIIVNFIDLDLTKFNNRKNKDIDEEI